MVLHTLSTEVSWRKLGVMASVERKEFHDVGHKIRMTHSL